MQKLQTIGRKHRDLPIITLYFFQDTQLTNKVIDLLGGVFFNPRDIILIFYVEDH